MLDSLKFVLGTSVAEFSKGQIKSFCGMLASLKKSAVVSGSTMVQVVLGEMWDAENSASDVDIVCTPEVAPNVRSWLIEEGDQILVGAPHHYLGDSRSSADFDRNFMNSFHHSECFGDCPEEGEVIPAPPGIFNHHGDEPFSYARACRIDVNNMLIHGEIDYGDGSVYQNHPYRVETLPGVDLPFWDSGFEQDSEEENSWNKKPSIDLLVTKAGLASAMIALEDDFDINICKCSFDGNSFFIPDPHNTFKRMSKMGSSEKKDLLVAYTTEYASSGIDKKNPKDLSKIRTALENVRDTSGIVLPALLLPLEEDMEASMGQQIAARQHAWMYRTKSQKRDMAIHNYLDRQLDRVKKYDKRGIRFEDSVHGLLSIDLKFV